MLGVAVLTAVFGVVQTWLATHVGQQVMHRLRTALFGHLQQMSLGFFTRTRGGDVQSRLTNDINAMQSVVTNSATSIASNLTTVVGTAVAMAVLSWRLALLSLVVLPPAVLLTRAVARMRRTSRCARSGRWPTCRPRSRSRCRSAGCSSPRPSARDRSSPAASPRPPASSPSSRCLAARRAVADGHDGGDLRRHPGAIYLVAGLPATSGGMTIGTLVAFTALQARCSGR